MIRHAGGHGKTLYNTGLAADTTFGVEVTGVNNTMLAQAHNQYLAAAGPGRASRSRALSLLILQDPLWKTGLGPAHVWRRLAWGANARPDAAVASLRHISLWREA
eukprot:1864851-Pyramimonas_sp.AAC.1